ncbi:hypothetical protein PM082_022777 [Marasmius tenuissimus]|nr:hypothetical protein PM082_022777 [Marasmius tenuissimus]
MRTRRRFLPPCHQQIKLDTTHFKTIFKLVGLGQEIEKQEELSRPFEKHSPINHLFDVWSSQDWLFQHPALRIPYLFPSIHFWPDGSNRDHAMGERVDEQRRRDHRRYTP